MDKKTVKRLTDHILYLPADHDTDRPILAAISGSERTVIVDAGNSPAHARSFLEQLSGFGLPKMEYLFITHWHWDHIFGMKEWNLPTIAHRETKRELQKLIGLDWSDAALDQRVASGTEIAFCADMIKKEFPGELRHAIEPVLPQLTFDSQAEIDLGGITCLLQHVGGDHAQDSAVLFVKEEKVLFLGDALGPAIYAPERYYVPEHFLALLEQVESFGAATYIESHLFPQTQEQFAHDLNEMRWMAQAVLDHQGGREAVTAEMSQRLNRELSRDDLAVISYFLEGYRKHLA
ncbi:MBL fold metallo-hydrolase [Brevibacillus migulae]|uniref:MBL fold metallo-hydrolase n=1 Tax=Brevibacillus migulae TaxID=1644114 RepID=UPI00106E0410|nr:MBL fold metallo-hydrolase [Brevibacillus migulae]